MENPDNGQFRLIPSSKDGARFAQPEIQYLPTIGPDLMWATDVGHIYDRKYRHRFDSRVFRWENSVSSGTLQADASAPRGTKLELIIRSADSADVLANQPWLPVANRSFPVSSQHRFAQYRATLISDNGDRYPLVRRVEIELHR